MRANLPPERPIGLQARGLSWRKRSGHWVALWVARRDLVDKGYPVATQRIWPPSAPTYDEKHALADIEDHFGSRSVLSAQPLIPTQTEWLYIASECERLQDEMLGWARTGQDSNPRIIFNGTLKSLINAYQVDKDSTYHG